MNLIPGDSPFTIYKGQTLRRVLTWTAGGVAVNLTGYTAALKARKGISSDPEINLTTENGGITLGGALGTITLYMSATATAALDFGDAVYDLKLIDGTGDANYLVSGIITCVEMATR